MWFDTVLREWGRITGIDLSDATLLRVGHTAALAVPSADLFLRVHDVEDDPAGDEAFATAAGAGFLQPAPVAGRHIWPVERHPVCP
jgi:hypothetical protein